MIVVPNAIRDHDIIAILEIDPRCNTIFENTVEIINWGKMHQAINPAFMFQIIKYLRIRHLISEAKMSLPPPSLNHYPEALH